MLAQPGHERRGEHHLGASAGSLERRVKALAAELAVHTDHGLVEVDVGPAQTKRFADPNARERKKRE